VPGLIAVAQATQGSVENVQAITQGKAESGLVQADVAAWAWRGTAMFRQNGKAQKLRAIAALFPESLHIVASEQSGIAALRDLAGKRVSLGEPESGTLADARLLLEAAGLKEDRLKAEYLRLAQASEAMKSGALDAFFIIAGAPVPAVVDAATGTSVKLLSIPEPVIERLTRRYRYLVRDEIAGGLYQGIDEPATTIGTTALWVAAEDVPEGLVYAIVKTLWQDPTLKLLESRHPIGRRIRLDSALHGIDIPLHPGAARFYQENGIALPPPIIE
jgi:uncharacterized protein